MSTPVRVRTFYNQDHARIAVSEICARCVQDILYLLDSATGPNGGEELDVAPDPETSRLYKEFRDWFAPNVGGTIQALVVGPLLSRLAVDDEGYAHIEDDIYRDYRSERLASDSARMESRAKWLACEIPLMIESYGELYEYEVSDALGLVADVARFDFESEETKDYVEQVLPELERWFLFSQPGGRMLRGDQEAIDAYQENLELTRKRVKELESKQKDVLESEQVSEEDRHLIEYEISKVEARIRKLEKAVKSLDDRREELIEKLYE